MVDLGKEMVHQTPPHSLPPNPLRQTQLPNPPPPPPLHPPPTPQLHPPHPLPLRPHPPVKAPPFYPSSPKPPTSPQSGRLVQAAVQVPRQLADTPRGPQQHAEELLEALPALVAAPWTQPANQKHRSQAEKPEASGVFWGGEGKRGTNWNKKTKTKRHGKNRRKEGKQKAAGCQPQNKKVTNYFGKASVCQNPQTVSVSLVPGPSKEDTQIQKREGTCMNLVCWGGISQSCNGLTCNGSCEAA